MWHIYCALPRSSLAGHSVAIDSYLLSWARSSASGSDGLQIYIIHRRLYRSYFNANLTAPDHHTLVRRVWICRASQRNATIVDLCFEGRIQHVRFRYISHVSNWCSIGLNGWKILMWETSQQVDGILTMEGRKEELFGVVYLDVLPLSFISIPAFRLTFFTSLRCLLFMASSVVNTSAKLYAMPSCPVLPSSLPLSSPYSNLYLSLSSAIFKHFVV